MTQPQHLQVLVRKITTNLQNLRNRNLTKAVQKLKINTISNTLKKQKIIQTSDYQTNRTALQEYVSILPQQTNVTLEEQHNLQAQKGNANQVMQHLDDKIRKQNYFEKYINQTVKASTLVEEFPTTELRTKMINAYNPSALQTIKETDYITFFPDILVKKKSWGRSINPMTRLVYKSTMQSPLTYINQEDTSKAMDLFQELSLMSEMSIDRPRHHYAAEIVNKVINTYDQFREEIFMQIIKQTTGSKQKEYLPLLVLFSTVVKISLRMYVPMLNYFYQNQNISPSVFNYMFYAMIKNFDQSRKGPITVYEAMLIMNFKQIPITVSFPRQKTFFIESYALVEEVIHKIVQFYELNSDFQYLLYYRGKYLQKGKIMDAFGQINKQLYDSSYQEYIDFKGYNVLIVFKNMLDATTSKINNDILYIYCTNLFLNSKFNLVRDDIITIAALKYYAENDNLNVCDIDLYIPRSYYESHKEANLQKNMVRQIKGITCTKSEARNKILQILKPQYAFMALHFQVFIFFNYEAEQSIPICLYIQPGKLYFLGRQGYSCFKKIRLNQISKWGRSKKKLCIVVQKLGIIYIQSRENDLICDIFCTYLAKVQKHLADFDER